MFINLKEGSYDDNLEICQFNLVGLLVGTSDLMCITFKKEIGE
jgi:hypothetical protein